MRRRLYTILATSAAVLAVAAVGLAAASDHDSTERPGRGTKAKVFVGYWMGIDPVDGGDSRRAFTRNADGTIAMIGRDSYLTLCDGTDRGVATFDDGVVSGSALTSDNLVLTCFNNGATVTLRDRFEVINSNLIRETTTTTTGEPVTEIYFHRVSEQH